MEIGVLKLKIEGHSVEFDEVLLVTPFKELATELRSNLFIFIAKGS